MKYPQIYDGDWVTPLMSGWKIRCCDCSLIHVLKFRVTGTKRRTIHVQVTRDMRATAAARRKHKK